MNHYEGEERREPRIHKHQRVDAFAEHPYAKLLGRFGAIASMLAIMGLAWLVNDAITTRDQAQDNVAEAVVAVQQSVSEIKTAVQVLAAETDDIKRNYDRLGGQQGRLWLRVGDIDRRLTVVETVSGIMMRPGKGEIE